MSADARARDLERALAEAWPSHRCAAALDDALVDALKSRFGIMTPFARRGALYAAVLAAKRSGGDAAYAAELASAAREDTDEWARFTALAMDENFERFDVERVETSVPAVGTVVRSIREAIASAKAAGVEETLRPRAEVYLTPSRDASSTHSHFTLRERREPKKRPASTSRSSRVASEAATTSRAQSESSMFAPARKPASGVPSFLRDTSRVSSFGVRSRPGTTTDRGGSKTMVIDVAEAAQLGTTQVSDPLRLQAQEERERKRQREKEAKEQRIQRLMEEREARQQQELARKRQRDEEILEKKKAYRAEIEAKRAKQQVDETQKESIATPSPTDASTKTW